MKKFLLALSVLLFLGVVALNSGAAPADPNSTNSMEIFLQAENDSTVCLPGKHYCGSDSLNCKYYKGHTDADYKKGDCGNCCCPFGSEI